MYACRQRAGNPALFRKGALLLLQKIFAVFFWATQHHVNTLPMSGLFPSLGVLHLQGRAQNLQCQPLLQLGPHCGTCAQHAEPPRPGLSLEVPWKSRAEGKQSWGGWWSDLTSSNKFLFDVNLLESVLLFATVTLDCYNEASALAGFLIVLFH